MRLSGDGLCKIREIMEEEEVSWNLAKTILQDISGEIRAPVTREKAQKLAERYLAELYYQFIDINDATKERLRPEIVTYFISDNCMLNRRK